MGVASLTQAQEVQNHGLVFEHWICDTFFAGYRPNYTEKWDIPGELNESRGGWPVNPKAIKYGTPVDMGDALRQFSINEPFWLVIGYWEQRGDYKFFTEIFATAVEPATWQALWHPITIEDLQRLDTLIKDRSLDYREVRRQALAMKKAPPFSEAIMVLHPKIDSRGQRRLQCSLRFDDVFRFLGKGRTPAPTEAPELWGKAFPNPIYSPPRTFREDAP